MTNSLTPCFNSEGLGESAIKRERERERMYYEEDTKINIHIHDT